MMTRHALAIALMVVTLNTPAFAEKQANGPGAQAADHLAEFGRLIGGQWHLEGSFQEFEWGVGRQSVKTRGYFVIAGEPRLVSEGMWFWHAGEQRIKGIVTAIDMPVVLFEYTTWFEGNNMVSDLVAYTADGGKTAYTEKWEFLDDTRFEWSLFLTTPDGPRKEMGGTYTRQP